MAGPGSGAPGAGRVAARRQRVARAVIVASRPKGRRAAWRSAAGSAAAGSRASHSRTISQRWPARRRARWPHTRRTPGRPPLPPPSDLSARLWRASAAPDGTPGARYLEQRGVWPAGERLPASVRWLPGDVARRVGVSPPLPRGAAGCVVYLFHAPGEADTFAAQLEAVDTDGERVKFYPWLPEDDRAKRPSVSGCTFDGGRRVFCAAGDPDLGIHLCEGPLDALAVIHLERLGDLTLNGAAVYAAAGTWASGASPIPLTTPTPTGTFRSTLRRSRTYGTRFTTRRKDEVRQRRHLVEEGLGLGGEPFEAAGDDLS